VLAFAVDDLARLLKSAPLLLLLLSATSAKASLDVCNASTTTDVQLAWATQDQSWINRPYDVHGWTHLDPGECKRLARGSILERGFWFHAEAKGVTLTAEYAEPGFNDSKGFCVPDGAFMKESTLPVADPSECPQGTRMTSFLIGTGQSIYQDMEVTFKADGIAGRAAARGNSTQEYLPSLFGAAYFDNQGVYSVSFQEKSAESARRKGLQYCREQAAGASCQLRLEFADQCAIVIDADKDPLYLATGKRGGTEAELKAWATQRCEARGNTRCETRGVYCSTLKAQSERQEQERIENIGKVFDFLTR
jgi:Protein of unknown function (DUF1036)/Domain of unknown function (DUF4189)